MSSTNWPDIQTRLRRWNLRALSAATGFTQPTISKWRHRPKSPRHATLLMFVLALNHLEQHGSDRDRAWARTRGVGSGKWTQQQLIDLRARMARAGINITQMAARLGVSRQAVSHALQAGCASTCARIAAIVADNDDGAAPHTQHGGNAQ